MPAGVAASGPGASAALSVGLGENVLTEHAQEDPARDEDEIDEDREAGHIGLVGEASRFLFSDAMGLVLRVSEPLAAITDGP